MCWKDYLSLVQVSYTDIINLITAHSAQQQNTAWRLVCGFFVPSTAPESPGLLLDFPAPGSPGQLLDHPASSLTTMLLDHPAPGSPCSWCLHGPFWEHSMKNKIHYVCMFVKSSTIETNRYIWKYIMRHIDPYINKTHTIIYAYT